MTGSNHAGVENRRLNASDRICDSSILHSSTACETPVPLKALGLAARRVCEARQEEPLGARTVLPFSRVVAGTFLVPNSATPDITKRGRREYIGALTQVGH